MLLLNIHPVKSASPREIPSGCEAYFTGRAEICGANLFNGVNYFL